MRRIRYTLPSQDRLKELFDYDPETGVLTHCTTRQGGGKAPYKAGDVVGYPDAHGYLKVTVDGRPYMVHRVIWKWVTGEEPARYLDHVNRVRADNRWQNLRKATAPQNLANSGPSRVNASGVKGVRLRPIDGKWLALATIKGEARQLGEFDTRDEAASAYEAAAKAEYGDFYTPERGGQRVFYDVVEIYDRAFRDRALALAGAIRADVVLRRPGWEKRADEASLALVRLFRADDA